MTIALRAPHLVGALIPVDNAPVDAVLKGDFYKYLEGMQEIQNAEVKRQAQADEILSKYENVRNTILSRKLERKVLLADSMISSLRLYLYDNSFLQISLRNHKVMFLS